ncbi:LOW QUALITY PROTEIN: tripartite motif-containing protein 75 [Orcinus orca]|uniref:LOW QUALITY PROTEIN: tripartite motif-containing protein 75 n=1 Tax=Orcinus orca TaxID=9733 RepID=UPI0021115C5C|nr:LOW QUALITY PROTEIN: tripartite motif-containing protein 75 [Orcinus orca]
MTVAAALAGLQAEANCSICLEGLRDPVTTECGHNSCRFCIQRSWAHLEDRFPCPVCHRSCQERQVRRNTQLGRMIRVARLLQSSRSNRRSCEEPRPCELHRQVLSLFCEEHVEVLCPLCARTPEHQGHLRPVGEAAADHRQRLSAYVEPLKRRVADAHSLVAAQDRKLLELRELVQRQRLELASEFRQLSRAVDGEQEAVLARLVQEEQDIREQLGANITASSDHICELRGLLHEVTERSVLPGARLLSGIGGVLGRCERLRCPDVYSFQLRREGCSLPPQHSALQKIIQKFREDVTLDPETAHPNLLVSEDRKSVTFARSRQLFPPSAHRFCTEPAVLDSVGFASGGRSGAGHLEGQKRLWTLGLRGGDCEARGPGGALPLELKEEPGGIDVYLDYELRAISFYSWKDRSHIHSFTDKFSEILKPYFSIGCYTQPLTICAVRDY